MSVSEIKNDAKRELIVKLITPPYKRAHRRIIKQLTGDYTKKYSNLQDYIKEIKRSNPGSTIDLKTYRKDPSKNHVFDKLYVCLDAYNRGFLAGYRHLKRLDRCFLTRVNY